MSEMITIARPYAKAIFEHAKRQEDFALWSEVLRVLAQAVLTSEASQFIDNPSSTAEMQCALLSSLFEQCHLGDEQAVLSNFLALLANNKRLAVLPGIHDQYEALRAEHEKTLVVQVQSYNPLTQQQQQHLAKMLGKRLQRQISLEVYIDKSLLGGAVIQAGDLVIDGSVRGKLNQLRTNLAA